MPPISAVAAPVAPSTGRANRTTGTDHLAAMRPALDAANAIGRPTDAGAADALLATGSSYLHGAGATVQRLDEGIRRRTRSLAELERIDPAAAVKEREQLDMLQRLRDRIQLSIERVGDILAGRDRDDIGDPAADEQLLDARRRVLAVDGERGPAPTLALVAGTYAAG